MKDLEQAKQLADRLGKHTGIKHYVVPCSCETISYDLVYKHNIGDKKVIYTSPYGN